MVVLYCQLHYSCSYSHLYLLVEKACTEGHVHEQQRLRYTLCSELYMCPMYFLVSLLFFFWFGDTREPGTVSLSEFFWCSSWAVSVSFCLCLFYLFVFSLFLALFQRFIELACVRMHSSVLRTVIMECSILSLFTYIPENII